MVLENRYVQGRSGLLQTFFDRRVMSFSGEIYRPLRDISYRIDWLIGGKEPVVYHATNILLHVLAALAAYWLLNLLIKDDKVSLIAAAVFAVHPLHTESVAWVKGRDDILFTLFYLLSFGMYLRFEEKDSSDRWVYYFVSLALFTLSLFSKELAVTLPIALILHRFVFKGARQLPLIPFIVLTVGYLGLRTHVLGQVAQQGYWGGGVVPTMLTMTRVVAQYTRLSFFPINQCADYFSFPISTGVDLGVILSLSLLCLIFSSLFTARNKVALYGGLFFFISLLPVLNIIPIKILIAERFVYLPLLGFCAVIASVLNTLIYRRVSFWVVSGIIVFIFFILTIERNMIWKDEYSLWSDTLKKAPTNARAHYGIGTVYAERGMMDKAERQFKEAIRYAPYNPDAYNALALAYYKKGMIKEAMELYLSALRNDPGHRDARYNIALLYYEQGKLEEAIGEYVVLLRHTPDDFDALNSLGLALFQKGFVDKALLTYRRAMEIEPESASSYNNIGMVYAVRGQKGDAEKWFNKALEVDPQSAEAYYNLGFMYQNLGRLNEAARFYEKAIEIRPDYKEARVRLEEFVK